MLERVSEDIKTAMKAKDKDKLEALRMLKSKLIENKTSEKPIAEDDVAISYCKKLKDGLELYPAGGEQRLKIENELRILADYLPKPVSEEEVLAMIKAIVAKLDKPNMGAVMKELTPQIKGRFDGKRASDLVKAAL